MFCGTFFSLFSLRSILREIFRSRDRQKYVFGQGRWTSLAALLFAGLENSKAKNPISRYVIKQLKNTHKYNARHERNEVKKKRAPDEQHSLAFRIVTSPIDDNHLILFPYLFIYLYEINLSNLGADKIIKSIALRRQLV